MSALSRSLRAAAALAALLAAQAAGFEIPLTRTQRAQKLVEEGQRRILRGDFERAIELCTQALAVREDWAPAFLCRGEARMMTRRTSDGVADALQASRLDAKSGEAHRLLGKAAFEAGDYAGALREFELALAKPKMQPDNVSFVYYFRARCRLNLGELEAALRDAERGQGVLTGIGGDYGDWSFRSLRAEILRRLGRQAEADEQERKVLELLESRMRSRPWERAELLRERGESHAMLREYDKSAQDYGEVLAVSTSDVKALVGRALAFSRLGRRAEALRDLDLALAEEPGHPQALRLRATERMRSGDRAGALPDLDRYLAAKPEDDEALAFRAAARRHTGDYAGALADIRRVEAMSPGGYPELWAHKAHAHWALGQHAEALEATERALRHDPDDRLAHEVRSDSGLAADRCAAVRPSLDWLVSRSTRSAGAWLSRGRCRCRLGELEGCLSDLGSAVALEPGSAAVPASAAEALHGFLTQNPGRATPELLRRTLSYYDRGQPLPAEGRLGRVEVLVLLAETSPSAEAAMLAHRAEREIRELERSAPRRFALAELKRRAKALLGPGKKRPGNRR